MCTAGRQCFRAAAGCASAPRQSIVMSDDAAAVPAPVAATGNEVTFIGQQEDFPWSFALVHRRVGAPTPGDSVARIAAVLPRTSQRGRADELHLVTAVKNAVGTHTTTIRCVKRATLARDWCVLQESIFAPKGEYWSNPLRLPGVHPGDAVREMVPHAVDAETFMISLASTSISFGARRQEDLLTMEFGDLLFALCEEQWGKWARAALTADCVAARSGDFFIPWPVATAERAAQIVVSVANYPHLRTLLSVMGEATEGEHAGITLYRLCRAATAFSARAVAAVVAVAEFLTSDVGGDAAAGIASPSAASLEQREAAEGMMRMCPPILETLDELVSDSFEVGEASALAAAAADGGGLAMDESPTRSQRLTSLRARRRGDLMTPSRAAVAGAASVRDAIRSSYSRSVL